MKDQLKIGIDLGTSRTAVMSDRGVKTLFPSAVGYPRDIIGTKLLNATRAMGDDIAKNLSYLDVFYPLETGVIKETSEMQVARDLLKYVVDIASPKESDQICAVIGVPARASFANKETLLRLANEVMDVVMVVSEPFMVAYGLNKLSRSIVIDIGAGTTDICALRGSIPNAEDQVTIPKGGDHVDEVFRTLLLESHPEIQITKSFAKEIKENSSFVGETETPVFADFRAAGIPVKYDISKEIKTSCEMLISPIVEQVEYLLLKFEPGDFEETLKNIHIVGGGSRIKGIDMLLADKLKKYGDVKITIAEDADYAGCEGALQLAVDLPIAHWNQIGDVIGL